MEGNGRTWQIAFWIMCVVCVGGMLTLVGYVVANDEKSTKKDSEIIEKVYNEDDKLRTELKEELAMLRTEQRVMRKETSNGFEKVNKDITKVLVAIAELKN